MFSSELKETEKEVDISLFKVKNSSPTSKQKRMSEQNN